MNHLRVHPLVRAVLILAAAVCLLGLTACSKPSKPAAVLHVYTWADYIKPELVARFEKEHACKVVIDTFDSNESMYAKIKAGATGYDLIMPTSYMVSLMQSQGMLQPLDRSKIPNAARIDPEYLAIAVDKTMDHSVPYMITNTGIAYLKSKVKDFEPSWAMFARADLKGRMVMLNDMRETIGGALKYLGYSLNTRSEEELAKAKDVVLGWKANLAKFENEQYKSGLASGEFLLVHGYSGDILQIQTENPDVAFAMPREGGTISCDDMVIPKTAKAIDLAHAFINFLHEPAVAAENTDFTQYLCPNKDAYAMMSDAIKNNPAVFLAPEIKAKCEVLDDLGADNAKWVKVWDEIKAAK
jgi:spermidine/putrescine transport system substrate-binding protein